MKDNLSTAAAAMGRRGGMSRVKKGLASLTEERRREIAMQGVEARKRNRENATTGRWLEEYRCGCSNVTVMKVDRLSYCPTHGDSARRIYKLDRPVGIGLAR